MNINLRQFSLDDIDALVTYANNKNVSDFMTDQFPHPYGKEDAIKFIENWKDKSPPQVLAIEADGEMVGAVGVHPQKDVLKLNGEIGYWIAEAFWNQGIASKAIAMMCEIAFESMPIARIYARIYGNNPASRRAVEKAGFKQEAFFEKTLIKNGEILDEYIYAKRK